MLSVNFILDKQNWAVTILYECDCSNVLQIQNRLYLMGCKEPLKIMDNVLECQPNTEITYSNYNTRASLVVINRCTDSTQFINTSSHEFYHLVSHLNISQEEAATLLGELCMSCYKVLNSIKQESYKCD